MSYSYCCARLRVSNVIFSSFRGRGRCVRVQACALLKACILELSMERDHPVKVWCVVAVGAVRSGRRPALWALLDGSGVEAAVGGCVVCIAQPPPHASECLGPCGSFGMVPCSWVNGPSPAGRSCKSSSVWRKALGIYDSEEWDLNLQVSSGDFQELWAVGGNWLSFSAPVTGPLAHRKWNSFNRWICQFPSSGGYGSCFGGEGDAHSRSWAKLDRAEMDCHLSDLNCVSVM